MWSDNETNSDFIDFRHMVSAVTSIINNDTLLPCSIGVFGDWGSGKSSLMKMIEAAYSGEKDTLIINFNGWLFEGYEDTKTVLMSRIVDEIIKKRTLEEKALKIAATLLRKIDIIKLRSAGSKTWFGIFSTGASRFCNNSSTSEALSKLPNVDYEKYIKENKDKSDPDDYTKNKYSGLPFEF